MNAKRAELAMRYQRLLEDVRGIATPKSALYPHKHIWHLYTVLIQSEKIGITRDDFMDYLKDRNVGTGLHFLAVHQQSFYRKNFPANLPNTEYISERIISLPLFPEMSEQDVDYVVDAIKDIIREHGRGH
jgi:dTDP-4-amino-4,6-dideoxygalactose transaminase